MTMPSLQERIEELLELIWTAEEDGLVPLNRDRLPESLRCFLPEHSPDAEGKEETIDQAVANGLVQADGRQIRLSAEGRTQAEIVVRRHRLMESLLAGVLDVSDPSAESTACQMEHILNAEVTNAVCAFLGHPPVCPHGRDIPRGACCANARTPAEPLIVQLTELHVGEEGRVAFIHTARSQYRQRLTLLGLTPGTRLKVRHRHPALVVQFGHTELALDQQTGREIYVRRVEAPSPDRDGRSQIGV